MTKIDFDALNGELETSAERRGKKNALPLSFDAFFLSIYGKIVQDYLDAANEFKDINYYFDLESKGLKCFMRRLVRRMNKFLFFKNFENQREFNSLILKSNQMLCRHIMRMEEQHDSDVQTIQSLEERIRKLEGKI